MRPWKRPKVKKEPVSAARAEEALAHAEKAEKESEEALNRAKQLAKQAKPVMRDLAKQRQANHFALDIYQAMLNGGK